MNPSLKNIVRQVVPRRVRNLLRSPRLTLQWHANELRPPLDLEIRPGWKLKCPRNALESAFRLQLEDPPQARELDEFIRLVQSLPKVVLLDIGCHFGMFSFAAAHFGGPAARALAIDPALAAQEMVARIAMLNALASQVQFRRCAAGATRGEIEMVEGGIDAAGYMVLPGDHPASDRTVIEQVSIDELAAGMSELPTLIKIDVESYELEVLRGGRETLTKHSIPLCLEMHNVMMRARGVEPVAVVELLREIGYRQFCLDGRALTPTEVVAIDIIRIVARKE